VPWLTRRPVVGVVQWLFAREKSRQYHLPFHVVERAGVASHRRLICVSEDLASEVRRRNGRARVDVVLNGVDAPAAPVRAVRRSGTVFLGRLDVAHKGLDLMIEAFALVRRELDVDLVVGGDGPDREAVARLAEQAGVAAHVHLIGRVPAEARFEVLARADLVVMPSRYETFGMVAAEALAVGTPVLAFDIACLRGLVSDANGVLVPPFDVTALAREWVALLRDGERRRRLGAAGPESVAGLGWDRLAGQQGQVYREMVGLAPVTVEEASR
jgi:glycosyltransferase involved in cell wall biosynthesis